MRGQIRYVSAQPPRAVTGRGRASTIARVRRRLIGLRARDVVDIVDIVERAGSRCVLFGGWGVDALAGRRTRRHLDLDLAVDDGSADPSATASRALTAAGFVVVRDEEVPGAYFVRRLLYEDRLGRFVDLHPAFLGRATGTERSRRGVPFVPAELLGTGQVGSRELDCLSGPLQLELHRAYQQRERDRADLSLLEGLVSR